VSTTSIRTCVVPDRGGEPPSKAVSLNLSSGSSSRSSSFSSTSSGYFLPSLRLRVRTWKWEFGLIL
uniref:Uncharacterized protein n=1 Tax=Castor canadensis TaxID=51338 RepID=A0A8C0WCL8_CASCN